jgi:hypothetical protein
MTGIRQTDERLSIGASDSVGGAHSNALPDLRGFMT